MRFPRQEYIRVGTHFLFQGIFLTQECNSYLQHCRWILYCWATREAHGGKKLKKESAFFKYLHTWSVFTCSLMVVEYSIEQHFNFYRGIMWLICSECGHMVDCDSLGMNSLLPLLLEGLLKDNPWLCFLNSHSSIDSAHFLKSQRVS